MRVLGFLLLFLLSFAVTAIWKFPVAGVLPHVSTDPLEVAGVSGTVWSGRAQQVVLQQPSVQANNVKWRFLPAALVSGDTAANLQFEVLGGTGDGDVARDVVSGDIEISDGTFRMPAANLAQFLPLPIVDFGGNLIADVETLELENNLLKTALGSLVWRNALVTGGLQAELGQVLIDVVPEDVDGTAGHRATLSNQGGDIELSGNLQIDINGEYRADFRLKPTATANQGVTGALGSLGPIARRESDGSYRIRNNGNIRSLM